MSYSVALREGACGQASAKVSCSEVRTVKVIFCDLGSAQAYCCGGYFESVFGYGDVKVYADIQKEMAMRR